MNNKELAILVYKHQLIQEIIKHKIVKPSVINRLIVEEIMMEDELEEARTPEQQKIVSKIANLINRKLSPNKQPDLEKWAAAIEAVETDKDPGISGWGDLSDEQKSYALQTFKDTKRYKTIKNQTQQSAKIGRAHV